MNWGELAKATRGRLVRGSPELPFESFSTDSRRLEAGQAFWALRGDRFDAHDFLDDPLARRSGGWILRRGAPLPSRPPRQVLEVADTRAALASLAGHHRRRFSLPVVGITGSNGKTTVKEMLRAVLARLGPVCANPGNLNNEIGLPLTVLELAPEHRHAVFELGASRPGDIRYLAEAARPTVGVLTNIGPAHLEFFGDEAGVFKTKSELVDALEAEAPVILNLDDPWLVQLLPRLGARAVTFGSGSGADARILTSPGGTGIALLVRGKSVSVPGAAFGRVHRQNAAAAAAAAAALGVGAVEIEEGLRAFSPVPLRFAERRHASGARFVIDAYNANPASMRAGIETFLETAPEATRLLVLGDMKELGPGAPARHRALGEWLAAKPIDGVFLAGTEMAGAADALRAGRAPFPVVHEAMPDALAAALRVRLGAKTAVYFKASRAMRLEALSEAL